ncbi:MAG: DUF370 domain-containing protein [Oscillospiraceae bacterium]|nr:DUF370 domain-containing protein [Oscillospiraceae bacterium]
MYLHIGNDTLINKKDIVAVFDLDNSSWSHITRAYLTNAEKNGEVINAAGMEIPRSFVVTKTFDGKNRVYLSVLGSKTLLKRSLS